jgi:hypothetical protein
VVIKEHAATRLLQVVNVCLSVHWPQHLGVTITYLTKILAFLFIGNGFNNTFYGHEHDTVNVACPTGQSLTVAACFYGVNSANPGCTGATASAGCLSMDVTTTCAMLLCNSNSCYFAIENTNFGDTCIGILKTFWMYYTCA